MNTPQVTTEHTAATATPLEEIVRQRDQARRWAVALEGQAARACAVMVREVAALRQRREKVLERRFRNNATVQCFRSDHEVEVADRAYAVGQAMLRVLLAHTSRIPFSPPTLLGEVMDRLLDEHDAHTSWDEWGGRVSTATLTGTWRDKAACARTGQPELWEALPGTQDHLDAKEMCILRCPVRRQCAADVRPGDVSVIRAGVWLPSLGSRERYLAHENLGQIVAHAP